MYRKTVLQFKPAKYLDKLSDNMYQAVFADHLLYTSCQEKVWICKTCDISLKRGSMPAQSKANNLLLQDVPPELSELNTMEVRLISLRIPFMKMVALPCGKQRAIHGPAVNVPTDLHPVCELLPRLPSQAQLVPMKLKRKLCYKRHYMYEYVQPTKIMVALEWLKANNPLYADVDVNLSWEEDAAQDDSELWEAVFSQPRPQQQETTSHGDVEDMELSDTASQAHELELAEFINQVEPSEAIDQVHEMEVEVTPANALMEVEVSAVGASILDDGMSDLALSRGYTVKDVPHNGNCLFSAVQYQMVKTGVEFEKHTLREQLVEYFEDHP